MGLFGAPDCDWVIAPEGGRMGVLPGGVVRAAITVTAVFPHGTATATLEVVISRRLRPDGHIVRPAVIIDG